MRIKYADIIVDISHENVDKTFQYRIPAHMEEILEPGMCVQVPFGQGNRLIKGYVISITTEPKFDPEKTKDVYQIVPKSVEAENAQILLAEWLRKQYGGTMIQALKTVLTAKKSVKKIEHKTIHLLLNKEEAISLLGECMRKNQRAKVRVLEELIRLESIPYSLVTGKLMVAPATLKSLEKAGAIKIESSFSYRNPIKQEKNEGKQVTLSEEQAHIVNTVMEEYDAGIRKPYLIHGITGSGKTQVYISLIEQTVNRGRQAIVLIPEIALTYQTVMRFYEHFGDRVSVMNSSLSDGEKYDQMERARKGELDVIIGPRSALFTPFNNIGMIIVDEEHESSYKSENAPKYHAREVAIEIAGRHKASVVLGSATPSLEAYYRAENGEYGLFKLTKRLTGGTLPEVHRVDLREELKRGNRSIFSYKLQELLKERLEKGEQSMLFINRRGVAGFISCRECGHVVKCPHCDVSLSEHQGGRLVCHYCGYEVPKMNTCPECGSKYISGFRAGTQQIEAKLREMFPTMRILRMDADTTKNKDSYEKILSAFGNGEADCLVGTQMIVKGHDFPNVTLVGVLAADLSLSVGDYRAGERTFQLLTQAAGRAGRGDKKGEVVLQTYQPEHYSVVHAMNQDYKGFYEEELLYRDLMGYPPVAHMMAVQIYALDEEAGKEYSKDLAEFARGYIREEDPIRERIQIIGPSPGGIGKIKDIYRFVFYVKHGVYDRLIEVKDGLEREHKKREPKQITVQFDFDPMNTL